ncbi:MAG: hypothetical protein U1E65_16890 [Myxococcota bacterium]
MTRRQLLLRGGVATGAIVIAGLVLRVAKRFGEPKAPGLAALTATEVEILSAFSTAALPGGEMPAADPAFMVRYIDDYLAHSDDEVRLLFRALLHVIEEQSLIFSFSRFSQRSAADRLREIQAWERTPVYLKRAAFQSMKMIVGMAYFEQPGSLDAVGWYVGCAPPHLEHKSKERFSHGTS